MGEHIVSYQQVDRTTHSILLVLVIKDGAVLQQSLQKLLDHFHKEQTLLSDGRVTLTLTVNPTTTNTHG